MPATYNAVVSGTDIIIPAISSDFDLSQTLDCGQAFRWVLQPDGSYTGVALGRMLHISAQGDDILLHNTTMEDYQLLWKDYFDLDRDYGALKKRFSTDPVLCDAIGYAPGIRLLRQDPWEAVCTFIISANNNIPRIKGIVERLCQLLGDPLEGGGYSFPPPQRLAGLSEEALAPLRCGYRNRYLIDAGEKFSSGDVSSERVSALDTPAARKALLEIAGVGPKVAECALLFGFGRTECFPMDTWMKKVMTVLYPEGMPADFLADAGIAQQYLFHYARHHAQLFA